MKYSDITYTWGLFFLVSQVVLSILNMHIIADVGEMFTVENNIKLLGWLEAAMTHYRDLVDNCADVTTIFTKEMWMKQFGKIQVISRKFQNE